jgi:hypothetical protein
LALRRHALRPGRQCGGEDDGSGEAAQKPFQDLSFSTLFSPETRPLRQQLALPSSHHLM